MKEDARRERKINRRPQLYQAVLGVIKRSQGVAGSGIVTKRDLDLFNYALGASGEIGDQARAIQAQIEKAADELTDRKDALRKSRKKKE
ncbi:MAG: hypothetical protein JWP06_227 [Candidatus Saccharibacteria bacterium]|nr:hypothetical protein [Candidatus Saccharibacteria bacterium]